MCFPFLVSSRPLTYKLKQLFLSFSFCLPSSRCARRVGLRVVPAFHFKGRGCVAPSKVCLTPSACSTAFSLSLITPPPHPQRFNAGGESLLTVYRGSLLSSEPLITVAPSLFTQSAGTSSFQVHCTSSQGKHPPPSLKRCVTLVVVFTK